MTTGANAPTGTTPNIRHNGRKIRPAVGTAIRSACNSGSVSNAANCEPYPAASYPSACTNHPRREGNRTRAEIFRSVRAARTTAARATHGRVTACSNRRPDRPNQPQSGMINATSFGSRRNRRATTAARPATIQPSRRTKSATPSVCLGRGEVDDIGYFYKHIRFAATKISDASLAGGNLNSRRVGRTSRALLFYKKGAKNFHNFASERHDFHCAWASPRSLLESVTSPPQIGLGCGWASPRSLLEPARQVEAIVASCGWASPRSLLERSIPRAQGSGCCGWASPRSLLEHESK